MSGADREGDRLTEIRVRGVRTLGDVALRFESALSVLVGPNGSGKSSLIESCELLRLCSDSSFFDRVTSIHGGAPSLLTQGTNEVALGATIDGPEGPLTYDVTLKRVADGWLEVAEEEASLSGLPVLQREGQTAGVRDPVAAATAGDIRMHPQHLALHTLGAGGSDGPYPTISRLWSALASIEVHVPFDVAPSWVQRNLSRVSQTRDPVVVQPSLRVGRLGGNLANVFLTLRNGPGRAWERTMSLVRLGLGDDVEEVVVQAAAGGGQVALALRYRFLDAPVPAFALSDGTLAYLAMVAVVRSQGQRSLLAFDEPELHFHPHLLARVYDLLGEASESHPVLVATHSDRFLDQLEDPASQAVLCELDARHRTHLLRPDRATLESWLADYSGLGTLRSEGYEPHVMVRDGDEK